MPRTLAAKDPGAIPPLKDLPETMGKTYAFVGSFLGYHPTNGEKSSGCHLTGKEAHIIRILWHRNYVGASPEEIQKELYPDEGERPELKIIEVFRKKINRKLEEGGIVFRLVVNKKTKKLHVWWRPKFLAEHKDFEMAKNKEEAFMDTKKMRAKKARLRNERDLIRNKRAKFAERKAGQKERIKSNKNLVGIRNQALVKFIAGCLDMNFSGRDKDTGHMLFNRTHTVFDNQAEIKGIMKSSGEDIKANFQIMYLSDGEEKGDRVTSDVITARSVNDLVEQYSAFIKESQKPKDSFDDEEDEHDTGTFAAYILKRLNKVDRGKILNKAVSGFKLDEAQEEKIKRYIISRVKGGHSKEESALAKIAEVAQAKQPKANSQTGELITMRPELKSAYEKIVAATGAEFTEELALAVKNEGLVYNCLTALFGRGGFRYEKSNIKSKKSGGFSVEFKAPAGSEMSSILSRGGKGTPFKLEHGGKSYEGEKIADIKAKMGKGGGKKKPAAKKAAAKAPAKKKTPARKK